MNHLLPFALALLWASAACAQLGPPHIFIYPGNQGAVAIHDMDGDGDGDILNCGSRLLLFEQVAPDQYSIVQDLGAIGTVDHLRFGDLDGDGIEDVILNDRSNGRIAWVRILGGGNYAPMADLITNLNSPYDAQPTDVDGDGDIDLIYADSTATSIAIRWSENVGNTSFGTGVLIAAGQVQQFFPWLTSIFNIADVDVDGDPDLVRLLPTFQWLQNDGSGSFAAMPIAGGADCHDFALVDIDGDTDEDLVLSGHINDEGMLFTLTNNGGGFAAQQSALPFADPFFQFYGLCAIDIEGDGDLDITAQTDGDLVISNTICWFTNDGSGSFNGTGGLFPSDWFQHYATGQLEPDGNVEWAGYGNDGLSIVRNAGYKRLSSVPCAYTQALDADGDSDLDVLGGYRTFFSPIMEGGLPWGFAMYENQGAGAMSITPMPATPPTISIRNLLKGDLDADGDEDAVAVWADPYTFQGSRLFTIMNNSGSFDSTQAMGPEYWGMIPWDPFEPILRDVDQDGDLDIVRFTWVNPWVHRNNGNGSFDPGTNYTIFSTALPYGLTLCDVDDDGAPDMVWSTNAPSGGGYELRGNYNDGTGAPLSDVPMGETPIVLSVGEFTVVADAMMRSVDLNNDGFEDLVMSNGEEFGTSINTGSGSFVGGAAISAPSSMVYEVADLDGNGYQDLLCIHANGDVRYWANVNGSITGPGFVLGNTGLANPSDMHLADMDGDGDLDLLICGRWFGFTDLTVAVATSPGSSTIFSIAPDPAHEGAMFRTSVPIELPAWVSITDLHGRTLRSIPMTDPYAQWIERGGLASGIYTLHVAHAKGASYVGRLVFADP